MRSIFHIILMGCFAASPAYSQSDASSRKPNIVLFLVDDMGWRAAVPMCAQTDLLVERIKLKSEDPKVTIYRQFLGGTQSEQSETYRSASPLHHFSDDDAPDFFLTGELDDPSTRADVIRNEYKKQSIPTGLHVIPGAPHGFHRKQKFFDIAIDQLETFLPANSSGTEFIGVTFNLGLVRWLAETEPVPKRD